MHGAIRTDLWLQGNGSKDAARAELARCIPRPGAGTKLKYAMRIAVSGSHATGKSTLVSELVQRLPNYTAIDEPFYLLEGEGHVFGDPPSVEDFELLFERSVSLLQELQTSNVVFDRSPADYLAYMTALDPALVTPDHFEAAATALATLDLVVFVPIERPDRVDASDAPRLRRRVDHIIHEMLVDDEAGFGVRVITVCGTVTRRVEQVVAQVAAGS